MILFVLISSILFKVFDITNSEPIEDAIIYIDKNLYFTDKNGLVEIKLVTSEYVIVQKMGYKKKKVYLKKDVKYYEVGLEPFEYELEPIEVKSGYSIGEGEKETFSKSDILLSPGNAASLFSAIKDLPSNQGKEDIAPIETRGGDPSETQVYIENARIKNPYIIQSPAGGLFSFIKTDYLKIAEFFPGGFDAKYEGGMSGVLDIGLKDKIERKEGNFGISMGGFSFNYSMPFLMIDFERQDYKYLFKLYNIKEYVHAPKIWNFSFYSPYFLKTFIYFVREESKYSLSSFGLEKNSESEGIKAGFLINKKYVFKNFGLQGTFYYNYLQNKEKIEGIFDSLNMEKSGGIYLNTIFKDYDIGVDSYFEKMKILSIFLNKKIIFKKIGINSGFRFTSFNYRNFLFSPRLNLIYSFNQKLKFNIGTGIYRQYTLSFSYAIHYLFSFEYEFLKNKIFKFDTYYKSYKNLPYQNGESNKGYGESYGMELFLKEKFFPLSFSYSLMFSKRNVDTAGFTSYDNDVRHKIVIINTLFLPKNWIFGIKVKYHSGAPYTPLIGVKEEDSIITPIWGKKNSKRFPFYLRIDLRISKMFKIFQNNLIFYLEGLNITNNKNVIKKLYSYDYKIKKDLILMPRIFYVGFIYIF
jgi:hypothetical protein